MIDYLVHAEDHRYEETATTFNEARHIAAEYRKRGLKQVTIDQYRDEELTGIYWEYDERPLHESGKLLRRGL